MEMGNSQQEIREELEGANRLLQVLVSAAQDGDKADSLTPEWRRTRAIEDVRERIGELEEEIEDAAKANKQGEG
jgi:hypothetical protein